MFGVPGSCRLLGGGGGVAAPERQSLVRNHVEIRFVAIGIDSDYVLAAVRKAKLIETGLRQLIGLRRGGLLQRERAAARRAGLEGLMAKRKGTPYVSGRSRNWLKLRFDRRQDCAIAGYLPMAGTESDVGALLLAVTDAGRLVYAGRVGTGFDARTRRDLATSLGPRVQAPEIVGAPRLKDARWVQPTLVCECAFTEWTRDGAMRHPRFVRLRDDKTPNDCVREGPAVSAAPAPESDGGAPPAPRPPPAGAEPPAVDAAAVQASRAREAPRLSNPGKVLFPRDGITKRDVWSYCTAIAPAMLPHLAGRPLTLQRYPDGIDGEEWYQQNAPEKTPPFVRLVDVGPRHDAKKRIVCDSVEALQWLANLAALTLHQWTSHVGPQAVTREGIDAALRKYGHPGVAALKEGAKNV